ncbi:MAG: plastocyanin/azurin family copper-binding protein [Candidatus Limnocylindria bacterium]
MTLVLLLAACASPSASPANGEGEGGTITISGSAFIPTSITVAFGEAIEFTNNDGFDHRIVQGENGTEVAGPALEAISLASGDRSSQIRFSPGTYNLTCTIHPSMNMTITVVE